MKQPDVPSAGAPRLFELTITLTDAGVDIERRVLVPEHYALADLHLIIQAAMGWTDAHLHEFTAGDGTSYGDPYLDDLDYADESDTLLRDVLHSPGDALRYVYDFGDYWVHRVELAAIRAAEAAAAPACIDGRGACPPEDCGGVSGYRELREVLADPQHPSTRSSRSGPPAWSASRSTCMPSTWTRRTTPCAGSPEARVTAGPAVTPAGHPSEGSEPIRARIGPGRALVLTSSPVAVAHRNGTSRGW